MSSLPHTETPATTSGGEPASRSSERGDGIQRSETRVNASDDRYDEAIQAWREILGDQYVLTDEPCRERFARSTSPDPGPPPAAILLPESTQQVQQIVEIAGRLHVPLYPISRGKNWGYGDACAPTPGQVIVDLARMNRVVEFNTDLGYVVIEPGVTQGQLSKYLAEHQAGLWMDCTGAGLEASILGNTLDRGYGHTPYGDHFLNTCGMEVVLADGRILQTGLGHFPNAKAERVYRYGVGPVLDGLFSQSNFGIVTRIGIWIMPKPEDFCAFLFSAPSDEDLSDLVDRLAPLRIQGLLQSTIHIANDLRAFSSRVRYPWDLAKGKTPLPEDVRLQLRQQFGMGAWNGLGAIYGTRGTVRAVKKALRQAMRPYRLHFVNDRMLTMAQRLHRVLRVFGLGARLGEMLELITPAYGLLRGDPSDEPLAGMGWRVRDNGPPQAIDPLDANAGVMWVSPVMPLSGHHAQQVMNLVEPIYKKHGFEALVTFTMISERAMLCISNIAFDKRDENESAKARDCYNELFTTLIEKGYIPYRTGLQGYQKLTAQPSVFWDVARQLKSTLDPQGILSPGRYVL